MIPSPGSLPERTEKSLPHPEREPEKISEKIEKRS